MMYHQHKSGKPFLLATLEGIEGSGKSTQGASLKDLFGDRLTYLHEPGTTPFGLAMRKAIMTSPSASPIAHIFAFMAARAELTRHIMDEDEHEIVLVDRYIDSTMAYNGYGVEFKNVDYQTLSVLNYHATSILPRTFNYWNNTLIPDLTFLLDISVEEMHKRLESRETGNWYDALSDEFYNRVRAGYHMLAKETSRFVTIDGTRPQSDITLEIAKHINVAYDLMGLRPAWNEKAGVR